MATTTKTLVIGVGSMGKNIALWLASQSGYSVLAYDNYAPVLNQFTADYEDVLTARNDMLSSNRSALLSKQQKIQGVADVVSPFVEISPTHSNPDVIIFMVINSSQIEEFLFTPVCNAATGTTMPYIKSLDSTTSIIIMSTCSPSSIMAISDQIANSTNASNDRVHLIDAPVSGGPIKARAGELSIMMSQQPPFEGNAKCLDTLKRLSNQGQTLYAIPPLKNSTSSVG